MLVLSPNLCPYSSQRGQASAAQGSEEDAESSTGSEESEDEDQEESQSKVIRTGARVAFQDSSVPLHLPSYLP